MGLSSVSYVLGWMFTLYLEGLLVALITISAIQFTDVKVDMGSVCLSYVLYVIAVTHQTFALTTLFSSPKLAGELGSFIQSIPSVLIYVIAFGYTAKSQTFVNLCCLFPQPALSLAILSPFWQLDGQQSSGGFIHAFSATDATMMLAIDVVLYLVLYLYLDQVVPNEYGLRKHPLFFVRHLCAKRDGNPAVAADQFVQLQDERAIELQGGAQGEDNSGSSNNLSSAKFQENLPVPNLPPSVRLQNVSKDFRKLRAVNNLSLSIYPGKIIW